MPTVTIAEGYKVGCEECLEAAMKLVTWANHDPQVTSLTLRSQRQCRHEQPAITLPEPIPEEIANPEPPPPPPEPLRYALHLEHRDLAGTGYDEP